MLETVASEVVQEQVDTHQVCEECDATFKSKRKFNMHMNGDHILIMNNLGNSSIKKSRAEDTKLTFLVNL